MGPVSGGTGKQREACELWSAPGPVKAASRTRTVSARWGLPQTQTSTRARHGGVSRGREGSGGPAPAALTIRPTQTLAASIMAPSAMERADSFSMWGFPESSSSTTCRWSRDAVNLGLHPGRRAGEALGPAGAGAYFTFRYSSRVMRPSLSESYMWNRTGGGRGRERLSQARRRGARVAPPPNLPLPQTEQKTPVTETCQSHRGQGQRPWGQTDHFLVGDLGQVT